MKKFVAILLTLMLVLGIGAAVADEAPATPTTDLTDHETVKIKKVYKLEGAGTSPVETFTLEQVGNGSVKDGDATSAPALGIITGVTFAEGAANANGATGEITVALPKYTSVGVYEYTLQEVAGIGQNHVRTRVFVGRLCSGDLRIYVHIAADVGGIKDHGLAGVVLRRESGDRAQAENHDQYQKKTQCFFHIV